MNDDLNNGPRLEIDNEARPSPRVVVALGLNQFDEAKMRVASAQAAALGASVTLLHVIPEAEDSTVERASDDLAAHARRLSASGIACEPIIVRGPVAASIVAEFEREDTTVAVIGSSFRRTLSKPALGGVADRVVGAVSRPILMVGPNSAESIDRPAA